MKKSKKVCKNCGHENNAKSITCNICGESLSNCEEVKYTPTENSSVKTLVPYNYFKDRKKFITRLATLSIAFVVCMTMVFILNKKSSLDNVKLDEPMDLTEMFSQEVAQITATNTADYFYELRSLKERNDASFVSNMGEIKDSETTSQEQKEEASDAIIKKTQLKDMESRVEMNVKNQGYDDAICLIDSNKVMMYVMVDTVPTKEESAVVQKIIEDTTGLYDITIEMKK